MESLRHYVGEAVEKGSNCLAGIACSSMIFSASMVHGSVRYPCLFLGGGFLLSIPVAYGITTAGIAVSDRIQNPWLYRKKEAEEVHEARESALAERFLARL